MPGDGGVIRRWRRRRRTARSHRTTTVTRTVTREQHPPEPDPVSEPLPEVIEVVQEEGRDMSEAVWFTGGLILGFLGSFAANVATMRMQRKTWEAARRGEEGP